MGRLILICKIKYLNMAHKSLLFQIMTPLLAYLKRQTYEVNISWSELQEKRRDSVRSKTTFLSTSYDHQTAFGRPRGIIFSLSDGKFFQDLISTLFLLLLNTLKMPISTSGPSVPRILSVMTRKVATF